MPSPLNIPKELVFLPLGEESLPLLKRGVIPVAEPKALGLPWCLPQASKLTTQALRVSEADYQAHLQREYARLPANLQGLLTLEQFMRQAESKRPDIEAALGALRQQQVQTQQGDASEWLMQRLFRDPYSPLAWAQAGWQSVWLGIDPQQWPQAVVQPVTYGRSIPLSYPPRLLADHADNAGLKECRIVQPVTQFKTLVNMANSQQGLVRLPASALVCVLLGASTRPEYETKFMAYWRQDLRYKRIPVARMYLQPEQFQWEFQLC